MKKYKKIDDSVIITQYAPRRTFNLSGKVLNGCFDYLGAFWILREGWFHYESGSSCGFINKPKSCRNFDIAGFSVKTIISK